MPQDKYIGKVILINLPNNLTPRYRWIVKKRDDGRYIARTPKIDVLLKDLDKKREKDYNSEHLLPKKYSFYKRLNIKCNKKKKKKSKKKSNCKTQKYKGGNNSKLFTVRKFRNSIYFPFK